ncbi:MAG: molybdenum cofactor biosynthesis protein MoaE [Candidatus Bathyarchaeota archaeon]|nr:molybdenum cofactor biosynthesis protein MoaE [Candidatus Bathyarchaeota archaeon]
MTHHAGVHEKGSFNLQNLMDSIKKKEDFSKTGAIGLFIGVARGENNEGQKVQKLTLEAYEEKANETLEKICDELSQKSGIVDVQIHHLLGEFNVGDDLVYVSVAGSHRPEVFSVLREAVERYKHEAPVFKKEQTIDEKGNTQESWVSEKQESSSQ